MLSPGPKDRFAPMVRDTECLRGKLSGPKSRDGSNKILHKKFIGGQLTLVGSNAPSGLAMRPIRILLCDEVDRYPASAGAEGDPVNLARKRTVTFWNRKIILVSTPTIKGASRIDAAWENSDKRRYWVPCPDCGEHQVLRWEQVRWDKSGKGKTSRHLPETAHYVCEHCGGTWSDPRRWAAVRHGEWRAEKPFVDTAGFHLNEIYSPWKKLEEMVREFLSAREMGEEAVKVFVNTSLGEVFEIRGEAPEWERIYNRREDYPIGTVPDGGLFLTAGADVQRDRIEGGAVMPLYPGDKMSSFSPNRPSDKFAPFVDAMNRHVAASLNMPYELLLKDFSKTNYSSARAALLEAWRFFNGRRKWLSDHWAQPVYELWLEEVVDAGLIDAPGFDEHRRAYARAFWIGPGRGWVDPVKEAKAAQIRMDIGVSTLERECAEQGLDWEEVLEQRARERNRMAELDLLDVANAVSSQPFIPDPPNPEDTKP